MAPVGEQELTGAESRITKIELPPFSSEEIDVWFAQVEIRLRLLNITDDTQKFRAIASSLPPAVAKRVLDIIMSEPTTNAYNTLKERIKSEFEPTRREKLGQLLAGLQLGDQKPTGLLREMRRLATGSVQDSTLYDLFLNRLPDSVRAILAASETTDLDKAAKAADAAMEYLKPQATQVNSLQRAQLQSPMSKPSVSTQFLTPINPSNATVPERLDKIEQCIASLTKLIDGGPRRGRRRDRSQSRRRYGSRQARSRSQTPARYDYCWYHFKFGANAKKCQGDGCKWAASSGSSNDGKNLNSK